MSDRERQLAAVRALIRAEPVLDQEADTRQDQLARLCRSASRSLPALGAAVTLMTADGTQPVAIASDPHAQRLEEQQFSFGEGPCVEAFTYRRPVLEPDLGQTSTRWTAYSPAALEQGVRAVFAFPIQIGQARLGVLDVYREAPGTLAAPTLRQALAFAEIALQILLDGQTQNGSGRPMNDLESAVESRSELFQAQGMVMIQLGVSLAEAMSRLRAHAYATGRPLGDVARDVVTRKLELEPDGTPGGAG